ncbi:MAG: uracil-DNA glycosylase [SAR324 cluster bacterium]|uniref:Uracil-DNA glycosylase n=1 Tax=SAR324 cluster bacterium TaxID=2024889 RepID=A0A2A4T3N7_9DELT|nr:MAG: uracil-DNA glycosylase [SAR324 cluster bacterium]
MKKLLDQISGHWKEFLEKELSQPYMLELEAFLESEQAAGKNIYPPQDLWFNAFRQTDFEKIKLVIIGQDPYMRPGQAMGLSFSVPQEVRQPPSLKNIFKELEQDLGLVKPVDGDLSRWAGEEEIFLLNASLTVEEGLPGSHLKKGWQLFTSKVIAEINREKEQVAFMAWGAFAHKCCAEIDQSKHLVVKTSHPSPLGAWRQMKTAPAFLGSQCFSRVNEWLEAKGMGAVNWSLI